MSFDNQVMVLETSPEYILHGTNTSTDEYMRNEIIDLLEGCSAEKIKLIAQVIKPIIEFKEEQGEACRAILTRVPGDEYMLSIANHRGNWQPTPFVGTLSEIISILTGKLAFALARWPRSTAPKI